VSKHVGVNIIYRENIVIYIYMCVYVCMYIYIYRVSHEEWTKLRECSLC